MSAAVVKIVSICVSVIRMPHVSCNNDCKYLSNSLQIWSFHDGMLQWMLLKFFDLMIFSRLQYLQIRFYRFQLFWSVYFFIFIQSLLFLLSHYFILNVYTRVCPIETFMLITIVCIIPIMFIINFIFYCHVFCIGKRRIISLMWLILWCFLFSIPCNSFGADGSIEDMI